MHITQTPRFHPQLAKAPSSPPPPPLAEQPADTADIGNRGFRASDFANLGAGAAVGAIGIGAPAALGMGAVKAVLSGNYVVGAGLGLAAAGTASVTVVPSLAVAAMSSDGGDRNGIRGFFAGAALSSAAAAMAIF